MRHVCRLGDTSTGVGFTRLDKRSTSYVAKKASDTEEYCPTLHRDPSILTTHQCGMPRCFVNRLK